MEKPKTPTVDKVFEAFAKGQITEAEALRLLEENRRKLHWIERIFT